MPSAAFTTLGCKVNQYETQKILESFERKGFRIVPFDAAADVYVINSCSVTSQAESKSRYTVRKASRTNPEAVVVMTGCAAQMATNKGESVEEAHLIVPNPEKMDTVRFLFDAYPDLEKRVQDDPAPADFVKPQGRTRPTIKIQDGCNIYCSYCSIPYTRPQRRSRHWQEVYSEIEGLANQGYKEVILTGVLIGNYGAETGSGGPNFPQLIEELAKIETLARIRISSIEATDVTPELIETIARTPKVCRHLHLPLQSGDTGILKAMNRPYTQDDYLRLCRDLYAAIPDLALTADIMVGFPGEDEAAFANTCKVVEEAGYLKGHIFRFSARPSTPAERMKNLVTDPQKDERSKTLMRLCKQTSLAYRSRYVGREIEVLVEHKTKRELLHGLSGNYLEAEFTGGQNFCGQLARVRLNELTEDGFSAELVSEEKAGRALTPLKMASV